MNFNIFKKVVKDANENYKNLTPEEKELLAQRVEEVKQEVTNELDENDLENVVSGVPREYGEERFRKM